MSHKLSHEHNRSKIRALHPGIIGKKLKHDSLEPNYANLVIRNNKIAYKLWDNFNSYGHNIEHNKQLF